jgi:hypothetical protein
MDDAGKTVTFPCPHCGGPLHLVPDGDVECLRKHRFTVGDVLLEQARTSARATWQAVSALRQRAQTARWAAQDPDLYRMGSAEELEKSAADDERTADLLRRQAQLLDASVVRLDHGEQLP